uniref:T4 RNA ligase 1-like N-terminal domain-containing protein n=1 Tax=viral metagenome TaxID=1070528 RepID=A0A6C0B2C1_9ZZZZ
MYRVNEVLGFDKLLLNESTELNKYFKKNHYTRNNNTYSIIQYNKSFLSIDLIHTIGLVRSVITNKYGRIISFAPPKSSQYDSFIKKFPNPTNDIIAEEFIEGTMVNIFWDETIGLSGDWEIATVNTVGGDINLINNEKTVRTMFLEAAERNHLNIKNLNPHYCYSFVLQHPENRVVLPIAHPQLYLVEIYEITQTEGGKTNIFCVKKEKEKEIMNSLSATNVKFPKKYTFSSYDDLKNTYASINTSYDSMGVIIKNQFTGERCKIRNPVYEYIIYMKGNQSKVQYQYLVMRKEGKVCEFLTQYPEYKSDCSYFRQQIHAFTSALYQNYCSCYIKKEKRLNKIHDCFIMHVCILHKLYVDVLKPKNEYITNTEVIKYVNNLHPYFLMNLLNKCIQIRANDIARCQLIR